MSQCSSCGAPLSTVGARASTLCVACGQVEEDTGTGTVLRPVSDPNRTPSEPPSTPSASGPDAIRVETLLKKIAAQSHFEERYDLQEKLAAGGMGEVFRAFDHVLRREVAIKMMRPGMDGSHSDVAVRSQFLKEARIGGRLLHPNVLSVFDLGVNRQGQTYYTMRLVDGASLQHCLEALERGAVTRLISYPLKKLVEVFVRACQGVDYAHVNGVLHLDLKPHNILVSGFNEVFVIDWGLAKVDQEDDIDGLIDLYRTSVNDDLTASNTMAFGRVVGTPAYMAPEQAQGRVADFSTATDVFGLGGILYFILYGRAPNAGHKHYEILHETVTPKTKGKLRSGILPRGQRIRREIVEVVQSLEAICLKCLALDLRERYATAEELIVDLNEWLTVHAVRAGLNE